MNTRIPIIEEIEKVLFSMREELKEVEAIGLCGSVVRDNFSPKSDLDIFIIIADDISERETWLAWNRKLRNILKGFHRDITVLVHSLKSLREISSWYVLRLASTGRLIYDPQNKVKELFQRIVQAAKDAGLIEEELNGYKYWIKKDLKIGETLEIKVE